jgi:hypothetical protein
LPYSFRNFHQNGWLVDADRHIVWYHSTVTELSSSFWDLNTRTNEICIFLTLSSVCTVWCPVLKPMKESNLKIEVNSKYSFTERKEFQFYKTVLESFNSINDGEETSGVIWRYLHQLSNTFVLKWRTEVKSVAFYTSLHCLPQAQSCHPKIIQGPSIRGV